MVWALPIKYGRARKIYRRAHKYRQIGNDTYATHLRTGNCIYWQNWVFCCEQTPHQKALGMARGRESRLPLPVGRRDETADGVSLLVEFKGEERTSLSDCDPVEVVCDTNEMHDKCTRAF